MALGLPLSLPAAAAVIGSAALLILVSFVLLGVCLCRRRKRARGDQPQERKIDITMETGAVADGAESNAAPFTHCQLTVPPPPAENDGTQETPSTQLQPQAVVRMITEDIESNRRVSNAGEQEPARHHSATWREEPPPGMSSRLSHRRNPLYRSMSKDAKKADDLHEVDDDAEQDSHAADPPDSHYDDMSDANNPASPASTSATVSPYHSMRRRAADKASDADPTSAADAGPVYEAPVAGGLEPNTTQPSGPRDVGAAIRMAPPQAKVERDESAYDCAANIRGEGPYYSHVEGEDAPAEDHYYNNIADPNYEDPEVNYESPDIEEVALGDDDDAGGSGGNGSSDGAADGAGILPAARDTARFQQLGRVVQPQVDPGTVAFHGMLPAGSFGMQARGRVVLTSGEDILTIITVLPSDQPRKGAAALRMAKILQQLAHPRIYRVLGAAVALERTLLLTEFTLEGTLQDHLRKSGAEVDSEERLTLARDVADALDYVSSRGLVHGDVRALNVLLVKGEARLTDFGQARTVSPERRGESLRWLAPELQPADKRTTAGDVFSFGVLLLELFENCQLPYSDCTWTHIETHKRVAEGYRSACPVDMPEAVYNLCVDCWEVQPTGRPSFATIVARLNASGSLQALQHDVWTTASVNMTSPLRTTPDHIPLLSGLVSPGKLNTRASGTSVFSEESNDEWAYIARTGKLEHEPSETELAAAEDAYYAEQARAGRSSRQSTADRPGTAVSATAADVLLAAGLQQSVGERSTVDHLRRISQASYEDALNIAGFDTASMDAIPRLSSGNCSPMGVPDDAERRGSDDSVLATPSNPVAHGPCNYEDMADAHKPSQSDARKPSQPSMKCAPRKCASPVVMSEGRASLMSSPLRPTPSPAFSGSRPTSPAHARRLSRRASGLAPIIATNGDDDETYQYEEAMMGVIPEAGGSDNVELVQMPKAVQVQSHAYEDTAGLDSDSEEGGEEGEEGEEGEGGHRPSSRSYSRTNSGIPPLLPAGNSTDILMAPAAVKLQNRLLQAADGSAATAAGALVAPKRQRYEDVQPTGGPGCRPLPAPPKRASFMARVARGRAPSREYAGNAPIFYETEEQDVGPGSDYMTPRALLEPEWLHGVISRQEAETLVADQERGGGVPGAFLFRRKQEDDAFGITVLADWDNVEHFLLQYDAKLGWYLNGDIDSACGTPEENLLLVVSNLVDVNSPWALPLNVPVSCIQRR